MVRNCATSTKWYSRPFCSPARGLRVVCETENASSANSARSRLQSVVFPAPEGEEMMTRRKSSAPARSSPSTSVMGCEGGYYEEEEREERGAPPQRRFAPLPAQTWVP